MNIGQVGNEREFLHSLATPLGTAVFLIDSIIETLQSKPIDVTDEMLQLALVSQALEQVTHLLRERRDVLIAQGVPSARS